tara:strand:- start:9 stop:575 length:567 start_codon:yes stop_codon:yes gene_type:complete
MNDWKKQLKEVAAVMRKQQKNKKTSKSKFDSLENFRGRKGFNDTGIALTQKTIKQQRKNKASYRSRNYEFSKLKLINEQRAADAKARRLENPNTKRQVDTIFKIADERIEEEDKKIKYQRRLDSFKYDPSFRSESIHITGKPYNEIYSEDVAAEFTDYDLAACSSVIHQEPEFTNKVDEDIWRLKNKK